MFSITNENKHENYLVQRDSFVLNGYICTSAVLTPGLLWGSGLTSLKHIVLRMQDDTSFWLKDYLTSVPL